MRVLLSRGTIAIAIAWLVATLAFWSAHSLPGDLALQVAGSRYVGTAPDSLLADGVRAAYGLERPLIVQYGDWLGQAIRLDFGRSLITGRPVTEELAPYLRNTFWLGSACLVGAILIAIPFGYLSGKRPGGTVDRITSLYSGVLAAIPAFLLGVLLIRLFIVDYNLGTLVGDISAERIALPAVVAALAISAPLLRVVRNAVAEVNGAFHLTFARMRGVPESQVFLRHGLRNAALPVVAYLSTLFVYLVYDLVVIEVVFNYPGVGKALHRAIEARDIPVIQYATIVLVLAYSLLTILTDALSQLLDPRIQRRGGR